MKDNDSYPPSVSENSGAVGTETNTESSIEDSDDADNGSDDVRLFEPWEGEEAEIVADEEAEEYEDELTGIKIKYTLNSDELHDLARHSEKFKKNFKLQKKYALFQVIALGVVVAFALVTKNIHCLWIAILPVVELGLLWAIPFFEVKKIVKALSNSGETTLEIFPDKIDVTENGVHRELLLDGSCDSEEYDDMLVIYKNRVTKLLLPMRAIEPEFRAEVLAIILSGVKSGDNE